MPMRIGTTTFNDRIEKGLNDEFMRDSVRSAQERLLGKRLDAAEELGSWEDWRNLGEEIRSHTLENLDYYLYELSEKVEENGGHVYFAKTAEEANHYIQEVVKRKNGKKIIKSKSMVTEEISMNEALESIGCDVIESDLGEYILQVDDHDPPSHIVVPALHKNKSQIRDVFKEKLGYLNTDKPEELTLFAREKLRKEFLSADIGITGCNFAVAESGTITLVTNEGNARLATTLPKTQITVMGMERIVPTWEELDVMISLLSRSAVGQKLTTYVTALSGPKSPLEGDGPEEFHLVIVDNGRSNIIGTEFQEALHCIRCAACINVCPVYRHVGGHGYGSIYPGPIGAVISPLLGGYEEYGELPFASTLCAACTDACPVKIPLHELLNKHRKNIIEGRGLSAEKVAMRGFQYGTTLPILYQVGTKLAPFLSLPFQTNSFLTKGPGPLKAWTTIRDMPAPNNERFRDWFKKRQKEESFE
ncbi:LutB/LldF family L-lactate oxidation iron-sulfur protein [Alkalihalobacillus macyae]|uniref:LutB/LldF family L-lactate oxidation iron-sulfur protein n=1 Tax=Guptibacillus hwajinpoensis TaxID=208199 RepID=UPI00273C497E|nr:LutB/LldF family L-lactate oxidation iron-sulfur protein [Alkalihalobacillus macyae]MDP4549955.1 LutB/LldF family L-lactate oxidation iron-sulfur protein [Alkalihalobacillus macyae]